MNRLAILEFRRLVDRSPELHSRFIEAYRKNPDALTALARESGFGNGNGPASARLKRFGDLPDFFHR
jgi:hypothetical protein